MKHTIFMILIFVLGFLPAYSESNQTKTQAQAQTKSQELYSLKLLSKLEQSNEEKRKLKEQLALLEKKRVEQDTEAMSRETKRMKEQEAKHLVQLEKIRKAVFENAQQDMVTTYAMPIAVAMVLLVLFLILWILEKRKNTQLALVHKDEIEKLLSEKEKIQAQYSKLDQDIALLKSQSQESGKNQLLDNIKRKEAQRNHAISRIRGVGNV